MILACIVPDCECGDKDEHGICNDCGREWVATADDGLTTWERK